MFLNGILDVLILICFSNVTGLVHSYIVITVFRLRALVSAVPLFSTFPFMFLFVLCI